jgi:hypothetical protein
MGAESIRNREFPDLNAFKSKADGITPQPGLPYKPLPVLRKYCAQPDVADALIEVLYRLLIETPLQPAQSITATPKPPCFSGAHE